MTGLIILILIGGSIALLAPVFVPGRLRGPEIGFWRIRDAFVPLMIRFAGIVIIFFGIASTSYVHVPDGYQGQLFRIYGGGSLPEGKIIAVDGENGPQARLFTPGFHWEWLVNVLYNVDTNQKQVTIPKGKLGVLVAKDGKALKPGQAFADPFPAALGYSMLDAETFLQNGGQRGPQLTVLTPGTYRLNTYLWDAQERDAKEINAGFVGVVKSNVSADIDLGAIKATKPAKCDPVGKGDDRGDVKRLSAPLFPVGCIGMWNVSLQPGQYYLNPDAFAITDFDTRGQVLTYAGGYTRATISLTVDAAGAIVQKRVEEQIPVDRENADRAIFVKMEGWDVPLELRVIAQVSPDQAPCVVAGLGNLKQIEDRVITPSIRAIARDVAGGTFDVEELKVDVDGKPILDADGKPVIVRVRRQTKVLDLINQRPLIESEIERRIGPEVEKSCVTIREVRLGEPAIPPELLVAVRREQLATQLAKAFVQEKLAQDQRVTSEKSKATANQQASLVTAEIGVQASEQNAKAARNLGQGEKDRLILVSEGQKAQTEVLGTAATVQLQQYNTLMDKLFQFANDHPEVLTAALTNANKFVPQVQVNGGGGDGIMGLLTGLAARQFSPEPVPSQKVVPATAAAGP